MSAFIIYNILYPHTAFNHEIPDDDLDQFSKLNQKEYRGNGQRGMVRKEVSERNDQYPGIYAVKKEGDSCLTAGTECEISTMRKCTKGHDQGGNYDKDSCQLLNTFFCVVNGWEKSANQDHDCRH